MAQTLHLNKLYNICSLEVSQTVKVTDLNSKHTLEKSEICPHIAGWSTFAFLKHCPDILKTR